MKAKTKCEISIENTIQYLTRGVGMTREEAISLVKEVINEYEK